MESSDKLGQVGDLNPLGNDGAEQTTGTSGSDHLGQYLRKIILY